MQFDGWVVIETLGAGDFAKVFLVERDGAQAALKSANAANSSSIERLKLEAEALRQLSHPSIPDLLEDGTDSDLPFFVMSLAPGHSALKIVTDWGSQGRVHGPKETLHYMEQLLSALLHMSSSNELVHRDIKDANIMLDEENSKATLIDFGFCKRAGTAELRDKDSFWRAGAARFSPPAKLDDPALAVASHDVFALGVIAYRLLTGSFPWSVSPEDGLRAYKDHVRNSALVLPHEISTLIGIDVSRLVGQMLHLSDDHRITAIDAHEEVKRLLEQDGVSNGLPVKAVASVERYPHVIRDPLRGDIRVSEYEYEIVNSKELQRLRWIRQLGLATLVFPGADHSRLSHSIGTLERTEKMMSTIEMVEGVRIDQELRSEVRLYALTHDVTHIAFGHTIEDQLAFFERHDENSGRFERLCEGPDSELGALLQRTAVGRRVLERLNPGMEATEDAVEHFVSSPMGADVLDYLDRDAFYCGLDHRVDSAVFRQFRLYAKDSPKSRKLVTSNQGKYGVRVDRAYAVESLLEERYAMFLKVYTHSAKIAADALLGKALAEVAGKRLQLKESDYEWFGDELLLAQIGRSRSMTAKNLAQRIRFRRLPRGVFRGRIIENDERLDARHHEDMKQWMVEMSLGSLEARLRTERDLARRAGVDASRVFLYVPPKAPGFKQANVWSQMATTSRPGITQPNNQSRVARKHLALWEAWVFLDGGDSGERARVAEAAEDLLQRANKIEEYRRTLI